MTCSFCNLEENRTLIAGKLALAILSNPQLLPGHTLIVPHRHIEHPSLLSRQELIKIFELINRVRTKLLANGASRCDIRQNYRPFIKQNELKN